MITVQTQSGTDIQLMTQLGEGGQGEVWKGNYNGCDVAVKLYFPNMNTTSQLSAIQRLVAQGSPSEEFLWPKDIVTEKNTGRFGYIMPIRPHDFYPISAFLARKVTPSFRTLLKTCENLARAFQALHAQGLCYRDISDGNVFFHPKNGDILICDNDNVDISGSTVGGILGTPRYMAPEIVRSEKMPDDTTDRYSLAVLLFLLLYGGHPLDGEKEANIRCLDLPALEKLYGTEPIYIWDPQNKNNRPVAGIHTNPIIFQSIYPKAIQELFLTSFTDGLRFPRYRIRESQWIKVFQQAQDLCYNCSCSAENFYDANQTIICWRCKKPIPKPLMLQVNNNIILLSAGVLISGRHMNNRFVRESIGKVVPHPKDANLLGLQNLSEKNWTLQRPDGSIIDVPPRKSAPLIQGNRINFGLERATVQVGQA